MYKVYQVKSGETIETIAQKVGINPNELVKLNGLTGPLQTGQLIVIPITESVFEVYTVQKGDNVYQIAKKYNINSNDLSRVNGLNPDDFIYPGQEILVPREGVAIYVTTADETIQSVANKLQVPATSLLSQNETIYLVPDQLIIYKR